MPIHAQLATGDILEFPDGTPDAVVDKAVQTHLSVPGNNGEIPDRVPQAVTRVAAPKPPSFVAGIPGALTTGALGTGGAIAGAGTAAIRELTARLFGADPQQARLEGQEAGGKVASLITPEPSPAASRVLQSVSDIIDKSKLAGFNPLTADAATAARTFGNSASGVGTALKYAGTDVAGDVAKALQYTREQNAAAAAPKVAVLQAAKDANLKLLPVQTNPSVLNHVVESIGGKVKNAQSISEANAPTVNKIIQKDLGTEEPLVPRAINEDTGQVEGPLLNIRANAVKQGYDPVRAVGEMPYDTQLGAELDALTSRGKRAAGGFPESDVAKDEVTPMVEGLKQPSYNSSSMIDMMGILREKAKQAYRDANGSLGDAYTGAAKAFENRIGRRLVELDQPELLKNFEDARTRIAKTYDVEPALTPSGDVNAQTIGARTARVPTTGGIKTVGDFARTQEKAVQPTSRIGGVPAGSIFDAAIASLMEGAKGVATLGLRPAARAAMRSDWYQKQFVNPRDYMEPGFVEKLASDIAGRKEIAPPQVEPQGSQIPAVPYEKPNIAQMVADQLRTGDRGAGNEIDPGDFLRELALSKSGGVTDAIRARQLQAQALKKREPPASVVNDLQWLQK